MSFFASVLHLSRKDLKDFRIRDAYSLHKVVYSLFTDVRSKDEKINSQSSGFLFADYGGDYNSRKILLLSNRKPMTQINGKFVELHIKEIPEAFLHHHTYRFKVIVNPTRRNNANRKLMPVKSRDGIANWFAERSQASWGFKVPIEHLQVDRVEVLTFEDKARRKITLAQAHLRGILQVTEREQFIHSFLSGIGRGRAFGCGLLHLEPVREIKI
jgi:CRISPR system Cascade subunit CasE